MKKYYKFFLLFVFCDVLPLFADTININWGVDNKTYTTTMCDIGGDVTLPNAPEKRGYTFKGWQKDSFYRGTWSKWNNIPDDATNTYPIDIHNNRIPKEGDYVMVNDASNYIDINASLTIQVYLIGSARYLKIIDNGEVVKDAVFNNKNFPNNSEYGTNVKIKMVYVDSKSVSFIAVTRLKEQGVVYEVGDIIFTRGIYGTAELRQFRDLIMDYSGSWRFIYHGIWETDGKNGWKPDIQISE